VQWSRITFDPLVSGTPSLCSDSKTKADRCLRAPQLPLPTSSCYQEEAQHTAWLPCFILRAADGVRINKCAIPALPLLTWTPSLLMIFTLRPMRAFLSTMQFLMTVPAPTPRGTPPSASTF